MRYMLYRNKVRDYDVWRRIFDSHKPLHLEVGLILTKIWRNVDDPNDVYFLFEVRDKEKADAFINAPGNEKIAEEAGVLECDIRYLDELKIY